MTEILVSKADGHGTIRPAANIVAASAAELRAALRTMIGDGVHTVTMDLSNVTMLDSAGIGLLVATHNSLKKSGGKLALAHACADILDLLRTMRIHQHLSVSGD